jgi:hypothetical protein
MAQEIAGNGGITIAFIVAVATYISFRIYNRIISGTGNNPESQNK